MAVQQLGTRRRLSREGRRKSSRGGAEGGVSVGRRQAGALVGLDHEREVTPADPRKAPP